MTKISATAEANAQFSSGVDVAGDRVVIGAWMDFAPLSDTGRAWIYKRLSGVWLVEQELIPITPGPAKNFGASCAISGNWTAIGEPCFSCVTASGGTVDIYELQGSTWVGVQTLDPRLLPSPHTGTLGDRFGQQGALDVQGDTMVIGAPTEGGFDVGAVYIYTLVSGAWAFTQKLQEPLGPTANQQFGLRVAIDDDVIAVAGLPDRVRLYRRAGSAWALEATVEPSDLGGGDTDFAKSIALDSGVLVVGASGFDLPGASNAGAVYVYRDLGSAVWTEEATRVAASDAESGDRFGTSVAVRGNTMSIGAPLEDNGGLDAGAVYIFKRNSTSGIWVQQKKLTPSDLSQADNFGSVVSMGGKWLTMGAPFGDDAVANEGTAYIVNHTTCPLGL